MSTTTTVTAEENLKTEAEENGSFSKSLDKEGANAKSPQLSSQVVTPVAQPPPSPPDGGLDAWLTVLGSTLVSFCTLGCINAFGQFVDFYYTDYLTDYSPTLITMIGAIQVFIFYLMGSFVGSVFDAVGPRFMIPLSGIITSFSLFMLSITKPQQIWQQYLTQSIIYSVGASLGFYPAISVIPHWFRKRTALALGFVVAGSGLGGIVFPILLSKLFPRLGFGWTVRVVAFIVLGCFAVASFTIKSPRPRKPFPSITKMIDFAAFRDPRFTVFAIGAWCNIVAVFNPYFYIGAYSTVVNGNSAVTPYLLVIMCGSSIPGRIVPGMIADKFGRFNTIAASSMISAILTLTLWYLSTSEPSLIVFASLYGFLSGPFFSLLPACVVQLSPIDRVGGRIGMLLTFLSTGALLGSPIGGLFIRTESADNFQRLVLFTGIVALVGSFCLVAARFTCDKRLWVAV